MKKVIGMAMVILLLVAAPSVSFAWQRRSKAKDAAADKKAEECKREEEKSKQGVLNL